MSLPNIPNINPDITLNRCDSINLLLSSVAMNDLGMSHILNAEGEKIQYALGTLPGLETPASLEEVLKINNSAGQMLRDIVKAQMLSQMKLEEIAKLDKRSPECSNVHPRPCPPTPAPTPCPPRPCPPRPCPPKPCPPKPCPPTPCPPRPCPPRPDHCQPEFFGITCKIGCYCRQGYRLCCALNPLRILDQCLRSTRCENDCR